MQWLRWLFFLICAWSVVSAWAEDKHALPGTAPFNLYVISLAVVAILAIGFEVKDIVRARSNGRD